MFFLKSKTDKALIHLKKQGIAVEDLDLKNKVAIIKLGKQEALLSLDEFPRMEAAIIFDASIINLHTYSNINLYANLYGCITSQIHTQENKKIKIVFKRLVDIKRIKYCIRQMHKCIQSCTIYLTERLKQQELTNLDLSMFEELDISSFDPKSLGEKKEFIYKSWQNFIVDAAQSTSSNKELSELVSELNACSEFEQRNKMRLSEIGDVVLNELVWNKNIMVNQDEEFKIN